MANILFIDGKIVFDTDVIVFTDDPSLCNCCEPPMCECSCTTWIITVVSADGTGRYDSLFINPCTTGYFSLTAETGSDPPYIVGTSGALTWNAADCHWEMTVEPKSAAWKGVYHGPSTPCPMGTFILHSTLVGSPPASLDVTT